MRSSFAILAMAISAVSAQTVKSYKSSLDMTLDDPNTVDLATRSGWCGAQQNTCDTLCGDNTNKNNCDDNTLKWECTCSSNSSAPGLQYYTQTIPTFICNQLTADCVAKTSTSEGTKECRTKIEPLCAEQAPPKNVASKTTTMTTTAAAALPAALRLPRPLRLHRTLVVLRSLCQQQLLMPLPLLLWHQPARVPLPPLLSVCWPTSSKS